MATMLSLRAIRRGIVGVGGGMKFEDGIIVDEVEELLGTERKAEDDLCAV